MDLKIDIGADQMKDLVSEALLRTLDDEKRDALVKAAIAHLVAPNKTPGYYGRQASPLEDAFNQAVSWLARDIARKQLEEDAGLHAKIVGLLNEAMERLLTTNREKTVERLADAIAAGMAYRD
jgi:hypothetical protein